MSQWKGKTLALVSASTALAVGLGTLPSITPNQLSLIAQVQAATTVDEIQAAGARAAAYRLAKITQLASTNVLYNRLTAVGTPTETATALASAASYLGTARNASALVARAADRFAAAQKTCTACGSLLELNPRVGESELGLTLQQLLQLSAQTSWSTADVQQAQNLSAALTRQLEALAEPLAAFSGVAAEVAAAQASLELQLKPLQQNPVQLADYRAAATDRLTQMEDLGSASKQTKLRAVAQATSIAELQEILLAATGEVASRLVSVKKSLSQSLVAFTNLSAAQQADARAAITAAPTVAAAMEAQQQAKALHEQQEPAALLALAKRNGQDALAQVPVLMSSQLQDARLRISGASSAAEIDQVLAEMNALSQANDQLQQTIAKNNDKQFSSDFVNATPQLAQDFVAALNAARAAVAFESAPLTTVADLEEKAAAVRRAATNLDGMKNLQAAIADAPAAVAHFAKLHPGQQTSFTARLEQVATVGQIVQLTNLANRVVGSAQELAGVLELADELVHEPAVVEASAQANADFMQAYHTAQGFQEDTEDLSESYAVAVTHAVTALRNALARLDGDANLEQAKTRAQAQLDSYSALSADQQQHYRNELSRAATGTQVAALLTEATGLQTEQSALASAKAQAVKEVVALTSLTAGQRATALEQINDAVTVAEIQQILGALREQEQAQQQIASVRATATTALNDLADLTSSQRARLEAALAEATTAAQINEVVAEAGALAAANTVLLAVLEQADQVTAQPKYLQASAGAKAVFGAALDQAVAATHSATSSKLGSAEITQLTQALAAAANALDGDKSIAIVIPEAKDIVTGPAPVLDEQPIPAEPTIVQPGGGVVVAGQPDSAAGQNASAAVKPQQPGETTAAGENEQPPRSKFVIIFTIILSVIALGSLFGLVGHLVVKPQN